MRNISLAVIVVSFLFLTENSNAQLLNLGVKGGYNLSDVSGDNPFETSMKSGFSIYAYTDFINFLIFAASGEAGYTQKGFKEEIILTNSLGQEIGRDEIKYNINYIDISILGKLRIPAVVFAPYALAGPSFGIKASSSATVPGTLPNPEIYEQAADNFKSTTFGMKFGIGAEITAIPLLNILTEIRYNTDFADAYEQANVRLKNNVWEFLVGVKF